MAEEVRMVVFANRAGAGRLLAERLTGYTRRDDAIVVALPRGGVPVAYEVAEQLHLPLDVLVIRKIVAPGTKEVTMGVIGSRGILNIDSQAVSRAQIAAAEIQRTVEIEQAEVERREKALRGDRPGLDLEGKTVILVDDGLASGSNLPAAVDALRRMSAARVVAAIPAGDARLVEALRKKADEVICLSAAVDFRATCFWYADFPPVRDEEVRDLLARDTVAQMAL
jgi:putative phosphoribosyl transferase